MEWDYLVESNRINSLFADWYTWLNFYVFIVMLVFSVVCFVVVLIMGFKSSKAATDDGGNSGSTSWFGIRKRAYRQLIKTKVQSIGRPYLIWYVTLLIISSIYAYCFYLIIKDPNILTTNLLQQLNEKDLTTAINFLYRFSVLGMFFIVLEFTTCSSALMYLTSKRS